MTQLELPFPDKFKEGDKVIITSGKFTFMNCQIIGRHQLPRKYNVLVLFGKRPQNMVFHENNIELCTNV